jgi:serine/threonine-protein kinase RsbW
MNMENVKLIIPKKSEYLSTIRLTTSALSNINGYNIDDIEDMKIIISEICNFFINNIEKDEKPFEIKYFIENCTFKIEVSDLNEGEITESNKSNSEMCILIIESLADEYEIDLENKKICFEKTCINVE